MLVPVGEGPRTADTMNMRDERLKSGRRPCGDPRHNLITPLCRTPGAACRQLEERALRAWHCSLRGLGTKGHPLATARTRRHALHGPKQHTGHRPDCPLQGGAWLDRGERCPPSVLRNSVRFLGFLLVAHAHWWDPDSCEVVLEHENALASEAWLLTSQTVLPHSELAAPSHL